MRTLLALTAFLFTASFAPILSAQSQSVKAVYHLNEGIDQASNALRNIGNHLSADPSARIVVVSHARGVDFLLDGAKDKNNAPYDALVDGLAKRGVEFRVCNFTLTQRKIDPKTLHPDSKIVPSGVAEVARLQSQEGFAYIKP
jgi:uncharacterized protein